MRPAMQLEDDLSDRTIEVVVLAVRGVERRP